MISGLFHIFLLRFGILSYSKLKSRTAKRFLRHLGAVKRFLILDSCEFSVLRQQLRSTCSKVDYAKFVHAQTCDRISTRESQLKRTFRSLLQKKIWPVVDKVEQYARERENSMREKMEKEQEAFMDFLWQSIESKIKEDLPEIMEIMMMKMKEQEEFKTSVWQRIESRFKGSFSEDQSNEDCQKWITRRNIYKSQLLLSGYRTF